MNGLGGFLTICCNLTCHVLEIFECGHDKKRMWFCIGLGFIVLFCFCLGRQGMGNLSTQGYLVILRFEVARSWYVFLKEIWGCESNDKCHDIRLIKVNIEDSWKNNMR